MVAAAATTTTIQIRVMVDCFSSFQQHLLKQSAVNNSKRLKKGCHLGSIKQLNRKNCTFSTVIVQLTFNLFHRKNRCFSFLA